MNSSILSPKKTPPLEEDKPFTSDPFFRQLYLAAFQGLHSAQFEDDISAERLRPFAWSAWHSACGAYNLFNNKEAEELKTKEFNKKLAAKK